MSFGKDDSLRIKGIAIILLCFHHMCYKSDLFTSYNMSSFLPETLVVELAVLARVCVSLFAFVSAYGLATIYMKKSSSVSTNRFTFKRWLSLMSAWWFAYPFIIAATYLRGQTLAGVFQGKYQELFLDFMGWSDFFSARMLTGINWYMFLAQLIVIFTPFLCFINKKFTFSSLLIIFVIMQFMGGVIKSSYGGDYVSYVFPITLGNYLAVNGVFEKIKVKRKRLAALVFLFLFLLSMYTKYVISKSEFNFHYLQFVAFALAGFSLCGVVSLTLSKDILLKYLGKYSANVYFIHIFLVRSELLHKYVRNVLLLIVVSLVISFAISVLIEQLKKIIRYNDLISKISMIGVKQDLSVE